MLATIIEWAALGKVVAYSFAGVLLLTTLFTTGVLFVEADPDGGEAPAARRAAGMLAFAVCAGILAVGLYVMFASK